MSKLDDISYPLEALSPDQEADYVVCSKQEIKALMLELIGDDAGINPNNKDFHEGYTLAQAELRKKVSEL